MNELIDAKISMLHSFIGSQIQIEWIPNPNLKTTLIDTGQFEQILLNLSINARDAIETAGTIKIETLNLVVDEQYIYTHPDAKAGNFVQLSISDSGCGIARENMSKIFEPFYTSKKLGKGTGLGLSIVYGIVRQNHGFVTADSEVGKGSSFRVHLPCVDNDAVEPPPPHQEDYLSRGCETVLLVDDEPAILEVTKQLFEALGYHVLAAYDPTEAVRLAKDYPQEIHLLCTDVVMPQTTGPALAELLRKSRPSMKLLFTSGFTENIVLRDSVTNAGVNFLNKPFSMYELNAKTRQALDTL